MRSGCGLDDDTFKALSRRSDVKGLVHLSMHVAALAVAGVLVAKSSSSIWLLPTMFLLGVLLVFLFAPLHECIHGSAFRSSGLNRAVSLLCGLVLLLPPRYFRAFHFAHHRFTQDVQRDPELSRGRPANLRDYLWRVSGLPYWGERIATTLKHARGQIEECFIPAAQRGAIVQEARWLWGCYIAAAVLSLTLQSTAVVIYWLLPVALAQPVLRLYLLAEHTGCPNIADMLANSRTTKSNALVRALAWNMPYHAEHHRYPSLPFHALPKAHGYLVQYINAQASGYVRVHRDLISDLV
ncbi:MAG: fatty acid desaturase [Gammaproteobacteria bacterium]